MVRLRVGAFTLIELLVVVSIIVLLLSLLAPAMDKAISQAEAAACAAGLRSWGPAVTQYAMENDRKNVQIGGGETRIKGWWSYRLAPYMGYPNFGRAPTNGNYYEMAPLLCPAVSIIPPFDPIRENSSNPVGRTEEGGAEKAWVFDATRGAYMYNFWVSNRAGIAGLYTSFTRTPGETPLMADSNYGNIAPSSHNAPPPQPSPDGSLGINASNLGRLCVDRHDLAVNVLSVDNSTIRRELGELWTLRWHQNNQPTNAYKEGYFKR